MSEGCLCACGHRTPQHRIEFDDTTPCVECACRGFVHADDDPLCAHPDLPKNKSGRVSSLDPDYTITKLLEPILGPKEKS